MCFLIIFTVAALFMRISIIIVVVANIVYFVRLFMALKHYYMSFLYNQTYYTK